MPQCKHIKDNGEQCKNNAIEGRSVCYITSHCGTTPWKNRAWNYVQNHPAKTVIGIVFTVVVAIPTLYSYATRITVTPGQSIRSHEPMGTVFNVTNNGVFTVYHVTHVCRLDRVDRSLTEPGFIGGEIHYTFSLGDLAPGAYKSLTCENVVAGAHGNAAITIKILYARWPMTHHELSESFSFKSVQADDGTWVWKAK